MATCSFLAKDICRSRFVAEKQAKSVLADISRVAEMPGVTTHDEIILQAYWNESPLCRNYSIRSVV